MLEETPRPDTAPEASPANESTTTAPEIIEIFGAEPLVQEEAGTTPAEATTATSPATDADASTSAETTTPSANPLPADLEPRFAALETAVDRLGRQASFLPPKLRGLGERIDALSTVLAHARCRTLLMEVLAIDDLVHSGLADMEQGDELAPARVLSALRATLRTLLEAQDISEIEASGPFDPARHQAVRQLPVDEAQFDGAVLEVDRRGFAHGDQVLRFAEVAVGRHSTGTEDDDTANDTPDDSSTETEGQD